MKRTILIILALMGIFSLLSANPVLTSSEEDAINALLEFRMYVSTLPGDEAVSQLTAYKAKNTKDAGTYGFSEEVSLILDSLVDLDILSYYQVKDSTDPRIRKTAETQYTKLQGWMDSHKKETPNKWTYCMAAEAYNWYLSFLPISQILSKGLLPKQYYQKALDQDPDMTYASTGLAQWQYYAPAIGGGGNKASKASFLMAVQSAKTDPDKFIAHLFYAQLLFQTGDTKGAEKEMAAAEVVYPDSKRLERFRQINAAGFSWYEFTRNFEDNRAKLNKPLVY